MMRVATYGTLRLGCGNWRNYLQHCEHVGTYRIPGFVMYSNGFFPYAAVGDGSKAAGAVLFSLRIIYIKRILHGKKSF